MIALAVGLSVGLMTLAWLVHLWIKNAAIVDVAWGVSVFLYAWVFLKDGPAPHSLAFLTIVGLWAARLSGYLFFERIWGQKEEGRYLTLRNAFGTAVPFKFFLFFQGQALLNLVLATPFLLFGQQKILWTPLYFLGCAMMLVGIIGETVADLQLKQFKSKGLKGQVCRIGLWNLSRHPNYFFEFLYWLGIGTVGASVGPTGLIGYIAPAIILALLYRVTGIPANEKQSLKSRGDAYRKYQAEVSQFVPWFPKRT